jgi:nitrous oxidase accessory protein NosD
MARGRLARTSVFALFALLGTIIVAAPAGASGNGSLYVSQRGSDSGSCGPAFSPCASITQAVANAADGARIYVFPGTYHEDVNVTKRVSLTGLGATIDATGMNNGIALMGAGASGSRVQHFTVLNAICEGILASGVDGVDVSWNRVMHNDQGGTVPNTYPECQPQGEVPGDCGEGLHLQGTTNSRAMGNWVTDNAGGILVSDDIAPSHDNLVEFNTVTNNAPDCGITVPGHNPTAGVFHNTIAFNRVSGNGEGGILFGAGVPGASAHDNRVFGNILSQNGFAGVTIHAHAPGQNLDNNDIEGNIIKTNLVGTDDDAGVSQTTGVLVFSGDPSVTIHGTVVRHNIITNNHNGVWVSSGLVDTGSIGPNLLSGVDVPLAMG